jgi:Tat protein translocase TatB subunit
VNLFGLSPGELLLILMVAMVVLGPEKLPEVAASLGKWVREFRRATEELTAQFAGDNPLLELQRAFSLTDDPPPAVTTEDAVPDAAPSYTPVETYTPTTPSSTGSTPQGTSRVYSDYFERPPTHVGISDVWTHGGLPDRIHRNGHGGALAIPYMSDDWTHGVPVPRPPKPLPEEPSVVENPEPVAGIPAQVEFQPASALDGQAVPEASLAPAEPVSESEAWTDDVRHSSPDVPEEDAEAASLSEAVSSNGVVPHPGQTNESVPAPVPAAAGDSREGDRT